MCNCLCLYVCIHESSISIIESIINFLNQYPYLYLILYYGNNLISIWMHTIHLNIPTSYLIVLKDFLYIFFYLQWRCAKYEYNKRNKSYIKISWVWIVGCFIFNGRKMFKCIFWLKVLFLFSVFFFYFFQRCGKRAINCCILIRIFNFFVYGNWLYFAVVFFCQNFFPFHLFLGALFQYAGILI